MSGPFTAFGNAVLATVDVAVLTVVETVWSDLVAGCATSRTLGIRPVELLGSWCYQGRYFMLVVRPAFR